MCTSCARLLAIAALLLTFVAPQAAMAQAPVSLTVGCGSTEFDAEAYYAKELGFFQKAGLNVVIQRLRGGPDVQAALVG
jgi:ABC-type nitrate/sulfonate/bicarbonate transport system substrate-binding protein